jgi:hypothetical protein
MNDLGRRGGCTFWFVPLFVLLIAIVPAFAMGDNIAGQLLDNVQTWFSDKWNAIFDPIYFWYVVLAAGIVVALIISWFVPFKIVRLTFAVAIALGIAYVAGGRHMGIKQRQRIDKLKQQLAEEKAKRNRSNGNTGGGWFGNWN